MADIEVKRTAEITDAEWEMIVSGFNETFGKGKSVHDLKRFYAATALGFSYHALAWQDGELAGHTTCLPCIYRVQENEKVLIGLSGGSFVRKQFRSDIFIFKDMYDALRNVIRVDNLLAIVGVSNSNSSKYALKLLNNKFLYNLPYHVLPVNPARISNKKLFRYTAGLYMFMLKGYLALMKLLGVVFNPVEKPSYLKIEYPPEVFRQRFNDAYTTVAKGKYRFTYRLFDEKGIIIAYIFDFSENGRRTFRSLLHCCSYIVSKEKPGIISFVGKLRLLQFLLFRLPEKKEPQILSLSVNTLVPDSHPLHSALQNPDNWNFSLLNFDVR